MHTRPLPALTTLLVTAALLALPALPAAAHARLIGSTPPAGGTVEQVPTTITLEFNEPVEADFGQLQVSGPDGERLDQAPPTAEGTIVVSQVAPPTAAGTHTVAFRMISADGHPVEQQFTYEVSPAALAADEPAPPEETTTAPDGAGDGPADGDAETEAGATPVAPPQAEDAEDAEAATVDLDGADPAADTTDGSLPVLPIAVVLLIVLAGGGVLLARRGGDGAPPAA